MKNSILIFAIASLLVAGCGNKNTEDHAHDADGNHMEDEGTHQHEDGAVHEDHEEAGLKQEEFTAPADSASKATDEHGHEHKEAEKH